MDKIGVETLDQLSEMFEYGENQKFKSMYKVIEVIGSGGFGLVVSALDIEHNKRVALKIV